MVKEIGNKISICLRDLNSMFYDIMKCGVSTPILVKRYAKFLSLIKSTNTTVNNYIKEINNHYHGPLAKNSEAPYLVISDDEVNF